MKLKDCNLLRAGSYINGGWCTDSNIFNVSDPATGEIIASVAEVTPNQLEDAIIHAKQAQTEWANKTAKERASILMAWFSLIMENQSDLAQIMTAEQGKPLRESIGEIAYAASYIEWFSEQGKRIYGDLIPQPSNDRRLLSIQQPIGVVSAITPWNYPSVMIARKAEPALASG